MTNRNQRRRNETKWKRLFYGLLAFNTLILLILMSLIFWPASEAEIPEHSAENEQESSEFTIRTSKQNLNELINAYLEQHLSGSKHQYTISLEEDVHLMGELPVFSTTVPLSVHLEPLVQENGDIILRQRSISIGLLELPNKKIMEYMKKYLPMPEWVLVNPEDEEIYVAVTAMDFQSNFSLSVQHIDLEANNITIKIKVPYETLGIDAVE